MSVQDELLGNDAQPGELLAAVSSIFDQAGIEMKTVLNMRQIVALSIALTFGEKYEIPLIVQLCELLMQLKVSDKGTGRKDLRAILESRMHRPDPATTMRDKLIGTRR